MLPSAITVALANATNGSRLSSCSRFTRSLSLILSSSARQARRHSRAESIAWFALTTASVPRSTRTSPWRFGAVMCLARTVAARVRFSTNSLPSLSSSRASCSALWRMSQIMLSPLLMISSASLRAHSMRSSTYLRPFFRALCTSASRFSSFSRATRSASSAILRARSTIGTTIRLFSDSIPLISFERPLSTELVTSATAESSNFFCSSGVVRPLRIAPMPVKLDRMVPNAADAAPASPNADIPRYTNARIITVISKRPVIAERMLGTVRCSPASAFLTNVVRSDLEIATRIWRSFFVITSWSASSSRSSRFFARLA
eukprot:comp22111_c0_seq1/m.51483 comp22111_c0_seq1/g.51483  ORF comp22111_c0_seq1/g.51483 comp22111_c0_seq1/m.51483 type:complete len:317 (+) comp22111_c0_seq1:1790-2740(+)